MKTKIISFTNHKGGIAKTTTTANVGAILAKKGYHVLLVDLDAQSNLTSYYMTEEPEETISDALTSATDKLPIYNIRERLDLVPSSLDMATIEYLIMGRIDRNVILKNLLSKVAKRYDYILLDCPPSLGIITTNALTASTGAIIPTSAEPIPVKGLKNIVEMIQTIKKVSNPSLQLYGIVITRFGRSRMNKDVSEGIRETFRDFVFDTVIRENVAISEASQMNTDVLSYSPKSHGSEDYEDLSTEIAVRTK